MTHQLTEYVMLVVVPGDAKIMYIGNTFLEDMEALYCKRSNGHAVYGIVTPPGKWEILGTVHKGKVDFDPSKIVICFGEFYGKLWYMDYMAKDEEETSSTDTPQESFLSLIQSEGIELGDDKGVVIKKIFNQ